MRVRKDAFFFDYSIIVLFEGNTFHNSLTFITDFLKLM